MRDDAKLIVIQGIFIDTLKLAASSSTFRMKVMRRKHGRHLMASIFTRHLTHDLNLSASAFLSWMSSFTSMNMEISLLSMVREGMLPAEEYVLCFCFFKWNWFWVMMLEG